MRTRLFFVCYVFIFSTFSLMAQDRPDALKEYRDGNYKEAAEICLQELELMPGNLDSYVVLGWSLLQLGRYKDAESYANRAQDISRYDPRIIEILGEAHYYQGHNLEALEFFQEYVNLAPEGSRIDYVYYYMGEIYIRLGRFRHSDIALSTAVRYVPGNASWWNRLGYARENAGEMQSALEAYEHAQSLNPQLGDAQHGIERTRRAMGLQ